ncbi:ninja-family protein AFP3-like [Durio zibethinus]|uniref:Ninja-family protein n=1 Tax=Durio zibethinus TaxID=66656 RepID=A0A6P5YDP2_DURZI|nr:ninja-family protein AFP3-like [Durio zibethinus]XP_022738151.1 ninja-family protein AFP3-like [Durio zibethinus]
MGEAKLIQEMVYQTNFSLQNNQQPTNLVQIFSTDKLSKKQTQVDNSKRPLHPELDLNLRLSLGGIYSGNNKEKPLTRSSSIPGVVTLKKINSSELEKSLPKGFLSLARSCSLPSEVERSRKLVNVKKLRIMRRVEAKKRVVVRQRNANKASDKEKLIMEGPPSSPTKIPAWAAASAAKSPALNRAIDKIKEGFRNLEGLEDNGTHKGPSDSKQSFKPVKAEPVIFSDRTSSGKSVKLKPDETKSENPTKKAKLSNGYYIQDDGMDVMKKMPSVTTTGDGPNGRKIEGFLYKYMKGQVSIVCVCHGNFLSPEEFVKHAGGKDVTNPMKHINVCSTSFSY